MNYKCRIFQFAIFYIVLQTSCYGEDVSVPIVYSLSSNYLMDTLPANATIPLIIKGVNVYNTSFILVQANSQSHYLILSLENSTSPSDSVNSTNVGIIISVGGNNDINNNSSNNNEKEYKIFITNPHDEDIDTLIFARPYSEFDPIPGGALASNNSIAHPFLDVCSTILTINTTIPAACINMNKNCSASFSHEPESNDHVDDLRSLHKDSNSSENILNTEVMSMSNDSRQYNLLYEVFLTYMYEGDMKEDQYWEVLIQTSTPDVLRQYATKVAEYSPLHPSDSLPPYLFVSYSGVGTVISVVVSNVDVSHTDGIYVPGSSLPLSNGTLYSSSVSYGCDFIPGEEYRCTKLINPLTEVFCASLLFVGLVLAMFGHRWLNFTIFISGFFAAWFILFIIFIQIPGANIHSLGTGTFFGSVFCGLGWLLIWHIYRRPLHSSILIFIETAYLVSMITMHFIKYSVIPSTSNITMFIVLPLLFAAVLITYSIKNIKAVHIFSCVTIGAYATILPFAFYFGSTLNYIVINAVASLTVPGYTKTVGYPPFQSCDIALLVIWSLIIALGFTVQLYRERNSPPFYPPNVQYWRATRKAGVFLYEATFKCCYRLTSCSRWHTAPGSSLPNGNSTSIGDDNIRAPEGEYQRAPMSDNNGGISVADEFLDDAAESFKTRFSGAMTYVKQLVTRGGTDNRNTSYQSFPRFPGESDEEVVVNGERRACGDDNGDLESVRVDVLQPPLTLRDKVTNSIASIKNRISNSRRTLFSANRKILIEEQDGEISSISSDGEEVDRRTYGIFGEELVMNESGEEPQLVRNKSGEEPQLVRNKSDEEPQLVRNESGGRTQMASSENFQFTNGEGPQLVSGEDSQLASGEESELVVSELVRNIADEESDDGSLNFVDAAERTLDLNDDRVEDNFSQSKLVLQ